MADSPEAIQKSLRLYKLIGAVLFVGTIVTVLVATQPFLDIGGHGFDVWDMVLGLAIASVKATLVAAIFMHLNHEKQLIYWVFGFALLFAVIMAALIGLAKWDPIHYNGFTDGVPGSEEVKRW
jgi:caa(3)-type oxidase subunit IV